MIPSSSFVTSLCRICSVAAKKVAVKDFTFSMFVGTGHFFKAIFFISFDKISFSYIIGLYGLAVSNLITTWVCKLLQLWLIKICQIDLKMSAPEVWYSCNNITTTLIQISRLFFGFFSKTNYQMII